MLSWKQLFGACLIAAAVYFTYPFLTNGRNLYSDIDFWVTQYLNEHSDNDDTKNNADNDKKITPTDDNTKPKSKNYLPTANGEIVEHQYYTLSYSEKHEQAEWVAYELFKKNLVQDKFQRQDNFRPDPDVSTESSAPSDYRSSGYDRGHLCPAADMSFDAAALDETFFMSNISPQDRGLNHGVWRELEENVRDWAKKFNHLYVVTGPVLKNTRGSIGKKNKVSIPTAYYKVLLDLSTSSPKAIAYLIPNETRSETLDEFACSIDKVEKQTGIDFFPNLMQKNLSDQLEANFDISQWKWNKNRYQQRVSEWNLAWKSNKEVE